MINYLTKMLMKRNLLKIFSCGLVLLGTAFSSHAYDFKVDGIYYNIIAGTNNVMVTYETTSYNSYSGDVVIPSTVTYEGKTYTVTVLGKYSIRNCAQLKSIVLPETLDEIQMGSFSKCNILTKLVVPNSVTTIGNLAIQDNPALKELVLGTGIKTIGTGAFMGDVALEQIDIPKGISELSSNVFANCTGLTKVTIPANITKINGGAFAGCVNLTDFIVDEANKDYTSIDGVLFSKDKTLLAVYPGGRTASEYTIPEGVKELGFKAFSQRNITVAGHELYDTSLKVINLPSTLQTLGNSCFQYLISMESINLPASVNWVGNQSFAQCKALKSIVLPDAVTGIDSYGFKECTSLTEITLGAGLKTIAASAFNKDDLLKNVTCKASVPPTCKSTSFDAAVSTATLVVPVSAVNAYKEADVWKTFGTIKGGDISEVSLLPVEEASISAIYNVNGIRMQELKSGLNIVKMSDGSVRKVIINK